MIKKSLTLISSSFLVLSLVACGGDTNMSNHNDANTLTPSSTSKAHFEAGKFGTITLTRSYEIPKDAIFIDVRNDWERAKGFAAGSVGGVVYEFRENGGGGHRKVRDEFVDEVLSKVHGDKNKHIILICASSSRTKKAAKLLADKGFGYVEHIKGGYEAWDDMDLPENKITN